MTVTKESTTKFVLVLTEDEARLLREMIQNPVNEAEGTTEYGFRKELFDALSK